MSGPGARAGLRLLLALAGAVGLVVAAVPLAVLVRREWPPLVRLDTATTAAAERAVDASPALLAWARASTYLGDPLLLTLLAAALAGVLLRRGRGRLAVYVVAARLGSVVLSTVLKEVVDRARPVFDEPVAVALGRSFPSGHALGATAFWLTTAVVLLPLARRPRLMLAGAVAVSLVVAASRVLLGVHYLSDVSGGVLLGAGWAAVCTAVVAGWRAEEGAPVDVLDEGIDRP